MTGNQTDAARALAGEGEFIGEGGTRKVYLIGDVAYKVARHESYNVTEFDNANELRGRTPGNVIVPEMTLHYVRGAAVLAMPYIDGQAMGECIPRYIDKPCDCEGTCLSEEMETLLTLLNFDATSYGNVIYREGLYYMVDLGCGNNDVRISA